VNPSPVVSRISILIALCAFGFFALAGVVVVQPGPESTQRLGLLFGVIGAGIASLGALLKAEQAAGQTNGTLDARIQSAVHRANDARRRGDDPDRAALRDVARIDAQREAEAQK
jgi:hypothetical protein